MYFCDFHSSQETNKYIGAQTNKITAINFFVMSNKVDTKNDNDNYKTIKMLQHP